MAGPKDKDRYAHEIQHHRWHIEHVIGPITPTRKKSVEIAEDFFGPKVNSTFSGIAVSQFDYSDGLRPEEKRERDDPQPHRHSAICCDRRHHIEVEHRHHEKQHQISAAQNPLQTRLFDQTIMTRRNLLSWLTF